MKKLNKIIRGINQNVWKKKKPVESGTTPKMRWIAPGTAITVANRKINGMVYVGRTPLRGWKRGNIDPQLRVSESKTGFAADSIGHTTPYTNIGPQARWMKPNNYSQPQGYWPSYTDIGPQARAIYLDWLASGRSNGRIGPGYVFLFFYGLERRFFADKCTDDERRQIVSETKRLLGLHGDNRYIRWYLGRFLETARIIINLANGTEPEPRFETLNQELPLDLRIAIGQKVMQDGRLSADWVLSWYIQHPENKVRVPMLRAFPECRALFNVLFDDEFPNGLEIKAPRRPIRASYTVASGESKIDLKKFVGDIPEISDASIQTAKIKNLVEITKSDLSQYSRFLGSKPQGRATIEAYALLPERIRHLFPSREMEQLRDWSTGIIEDDDGLVEVGRVIIQLEGSRPITIKKKQLIGAADALARLSIGMAPDPRFALRSPKLGESVVLFPLPGGITKLEQVSNEYKTLLLSIALGSFVAHADGSIREKERRALQTRIDEAGLSKTESIRLSANLKWMLSIPLDLGLLRRRLKDVPDETRRRLGQLALSMAAIDGDIDHNEIKAMEKLYRALELPTEDLYSNIHSHTATDVPVSARPSTTKSPEDGPPSSLSGEGRVELDTNRISSLMADTEMVSSVLGEIFEDEDVDDETEETHDHSDGRFPGLDAETVAFLEELLNQPQWDKPTLNNLAEQFQLMLDGTLESLNDWSFDHFDDALIEENDERYDLNPDVVEQLQN